MTAAERASAAELDPRRDVVLRLVPDGSIGRHRTRWRRSVKRTVDLGVTVTALPCVVPVMVAIAAIIKVGSPGPVFFRQERLGRDGRTFRMFKFRTMYQDAPQRLLAETGLREAYLSNDFKLPLDDDPRVVPGTAFLRRWSLDELPQLFDVLAGRMSLVGPRPIVPDEIERYGPHAWAYCEVKPGITGPWQSAGRNDIRYPERAELDVDYVRSWSLRSDAKILLRTAPRVLRQLGTS